MNEVDIRVSRSRDLKAKRLHCKSTIGVSSYLSPKILIVRPSGWIVNCLVEEFD